MLIVWQSMVISGCEQGQLSIALIPGGMSNIVGRFLILVLLLQLGCLITVICMEEVSLVG